MPFLSSLKQFSAMMKAAASKDEKQRIQANTAATVEPRVSVQSNWTPVTLDTVKTLADSGNLRNAADLVDALMGDGRVQSALSQRVRGLLALPLDFETGEERTDEEKAEDKVLSALRSDWFLAFPETELFELYSWGILLGVGLAELIWPESASGRLVPRLKLWNPRWLSWDWEARVWKLEIDGGDKITITPGDGHWLLYSPGGGARPWNSGLWRSLGKAWLLKGDSVVGWAQHSELHGSPIRAFVGPPGMARGALEKVEGKLSDARGFASVCLPNGSDLKLIESTAKTYETFISSINWACEEISVAILGQNLTTKVDGGSLAATNAHAEVAKRIVTADAQVESTTLRDQVLTYWAAWNFGDESLAPWPKRETSANDNLKDAIVSYQNLGYAVRALKEGGVPVDVRALSEKVGLPLLTDAEAAAQAKAEMETAAAQQALLESQRQKLDSPSGAPQNASKARILMQAHSALDGQESLPKGANQGLDYCDALEDEAYEQAKALVERQNEDIMAAIELAQSPEDLEARLDALFDHLESAELNALTERALLLAELSGRYAALKDV